MKYKDIKTKKELRKRVVDGKLSVGCYYQNIKHLLSRSKQTRSQVKVAVIYSPGYGGVAEIDRYI